MNPSNHMRGFATLLTLVFGSYLLVLVGGCGDRPEPETRPAVSTGQLTESEIHKMLVGVWRTDRTMSDGRTYVGLITLRSDGVMGINGVFGGKGRPSSYTERGVWRTDGMELVTIVTNSTWRTVSSPITNHTALDTLTESNYTYRVESGQTHTVWKQERPNN